jgi:hypothetical protein
MTSPDPMHAYSQASRNLEVARERGKAMAERIAAAAEPFKYHWAEVRVVNGREFSGGDGRHERVDLEDWPNREEVWDTVKAYHDAFNAAVDAWHAIPSDDRFGMRPPTHTGE